MSYIRQASRGIGVIFIMNVLAFIVAYITRIILARNLSVYEYGLFYSVFTFIMFFLFFRNLGLPQAVIKYIAEFRVNNQFEKIKSVIYSSILMQLLSSLFFAFVFFLLAPILGKYYFKDEEGIVILRLLIVYLFFSISFGTFRGFFLGFKKFKYFALIDFIKNSIILISILLFFRFNLDIYSPVFAYIIAGPIMIILFFPLILKTFNLCKYKLEAFNGVSKKLISFGLPVIFTDVGYKVISYVDTLILTYFRPLGEVGVYNVVLPTAVAFITISSSINSVVFPLFSELWAKKDFKKMSEGLRLLHKYVFIITAPIIFSLFSFSDIFIGVLFGKEYTSGIFTLQILLVGVFLFIVAGINHSIISAIGNPKSVTMIIVLAALINLILNIILIPFYGINGAAVATTICYGFAFVVSTLLVNRYIPSNPPFLEWVKTGLLSICFVIFIGIIRNFLSINIYVEGLISIFVAGVLYLIFSYYFGLLDIREIKYYLKLILKKSSK